ncbi:uncharacterized protein LOC118078714 [Zootoca vivipara]|uniref:uncharacterized protein LOC118078714 n=1 Tax=Zootoca vivipara TaxID=8524 RepID=UPI00158FB60E|nr:uncharacterized protein LOC118078714 [Zootoca vivipara]
MARTCTADYLGTRIGRGGHRWGPPAGTSALCTALAFVFCSCLTLPSIIGAKDEGDRPFYTLSGGQRLSPGLNHHCTWRHRVATLNMAALHQEVSAGHNRLRRAAILQKNHRPDSYHSIWNDNTYVKDISRFAELLNYSDCWVCLHIPPQSSHSGILLHGIPINDSYKISNNMKDNHTSSPPVILSLLETAPRCFRFNHNSSRFLGHYPYCNWTYEYVNGSSCFLNVTTQSGRPKVTINNVTRYMTYYQQATCRDFHSWFDWMKKSWRATCVLQQNLWLLCGKKAYKEISSAFPGTCTLGVVIPLVYKLDALPRTRLRNKREVNVPITQYTGTQIARSIFPLVGVAMNYRDLHRLANWAEALFNATIKGMKLITTELQEVREVTLQNTYLCMCKIMVLT